MYIPYCLATVANWTVGHIRLLNQSLAALDVSDLSELAPEAVEDSLDTLGKAGLSKEQAASLVSKLSDVWSPAGKMRQPLSHSQITSLGSLSCAMQASRFAHRLHDTSVLCSLSSPKCYTDAQARQIFPIPFFLFSWLASSSEALSCLFHSGHDCLLPLSCCPLDQL